MLRPYLKALRPAQVLVRTAGLRTLSSVPEINTVGVVGMGLMGHGIAQVAAMAGYQVVAFEKEKKFYDKGLERIETSVNKIAARKVKKEGGDQSQVSAIVKDTLSRVSYIPEVSGFKACDLIIEAIVEDASVKKSLYKELGAIAKPETILASNTSSLPIDMMAQASGRPSQVIGLHFFNPVQIMQLVEVIRTDATDNAVVESGFAFCKSIKKTPVACKDTPGFIVNRLLVPYMSQAMAMVDRGDASVQDIDTAMRLGAGHPMGPLHLADYVGLDTCLLILEGWVKNFPNEPAFFIPECLKQKVAAGKIGRKSGEGFYKWEGDQVVM